MSKKSVLLNAALLLLTALLFGLWPELDLAVAQYFYGAGAFAGAGTGERALRRVFYFAPLLVPLAMVLLWVAPKLGLSPPARFVPSGRSMIFVLLSLALAPGLLVNGVLKEYSGRPRPIHVKEFGGSVDFRPWNRIDGACRSNCSFVSGEVSASAWLTAPASLAPVPYRVPLMAAAMVFAAATGWLRMAFGGHFLSDVLFAILFTLLVVQVLYWRLFGKRDQAG